jgi:hypothetical protein
MTILTKILGALGGGYVLYLLVVWIIKRVVDASLQRRADEFRILLQRDVDLQVESLKVSLGVIAYEQQVRFSKLHEKRAEIIAELYSQIVELPSYAWKFILQSPSDVEQARIASDKVRETDLFVAKNRIYFPPDVCELLDKFVWTLRSMITHVQVYWKDRSYLTPQMIEQQNAVMLKAVTQLESEVPALTKNLENEFRSLLGGPTTSAAKRIGGEGD